MSFTYCAKFEGNMNRNKIFNSTDSDCMTDSLCNALVKKERDQEMG